MTITWVTFHSLPVLVVLGQMNEVISEGDADRIITLLQQASAKLTGVRPKNAELYAILLTEVKVQKAKVGRWGSY